jgi:hypothetical protein
MTLPIQHPFWAELAIVFSVTALTMVWVHARALRIVSPEVVAKLGSPRVRRDSAVAAGFLALVAGLVASVVYLRWADYSPDFAAWMFALLGLGGGLVLSLVAIVLGTRQRIRGGAEMVVLNVVWAVAYGVLLPRAAVWWAGG